MSYLFTQAEHDAHQEVPFSPEEIEARCELKRIEYIQKSNAMVIDKGLFGKKDLGKLNLHEIVALYERPYGKMTVNKWLEGGFICFLSDDEFSDEKLYYSKTALEKFEFMKVNHDHKYQVDIEILYKYEEDKEPFYDKFYDEKPGPFCSLEYFKHQHAFIVSIDGELMTDNSPKNSYMWDFHVYYKDSEKSMIKNINERAQMINLKQWKLNIAKTTEKLMQVAMHPRRLVRHLELGGEPEDF